MGICVSHRSTIRIIEEMGKNYDDSVKEWCSTIAKQLWQVIIMYYYYSLINV